MMFLLLLFVCSRKGVAREQTAPPTGIYDSNTFTRSKLLGHFTGSDYDRPQTGEKGGA
jgi:hypothetical protein